jgi:hypothetical protein
MDPDPNADPAIFLSDLQDVNKKQIFENNFFCLLLFEGTFTSFFKDKKSYRSHKSDKTVGIFSLFLLDDGRIRVRNTDVRYCSPADVSIQLQFCVY